MVDMVDRFYTDGKIDKNGNLYLGGKTKDCKHKSKNCNKNCICFYIECHGRYGTEPEDIDHTKYINLCDDIVISVQNLKIES